MSRINIYKTQLNKDSLLTTLIKEKACNYSCNSLTSPEAVYQIMEDIFHMSSNAEEYCYLLCLNTKNLLIGVFELSHGTVNTSQVGVRELLIRALLCGSTNIILVHNHPSQITVPSEQDVLTTKRVHDAAELVGLVLQDHLIIGNGFTSLKEQGLF